MVTFTMYKLPKNRFIITTLVTFAILTTMTVMVQQVYGLGGTLGKLAEEAEDSQLGENLGDLAESTTGARSTGEIQDKADQSWQDMRDQSYKYYQEDVCIPNMFNDCGLGEKAGELAESTTGARSIQDVENSQLGQQAGDYAEEQTGYRSTGDVQRDYADDGKLQKLEQSEAGKVAGDIFEDKIGYRSTGDVQRDYADDGKLQKLEQSEAGKVAGDYAEEQTGYRSTGDVGVFDIVIPFTIPTPKPIGASVQMTGDFKNIKDTEFKLTIAGLEPTSTTLNDYTIVQKFEATLEDLLRDLFPELGLHTNIEKGKEMINDMFGIEIGPLAKFKMDVSVKVPIPQSVNDITQIENLVPIPKLVLQGCYNKMSNNLDVKEEAQQRAGDYAEEQTGYRSTGDVQRDYEDLDAILEQDNDGQQANDLEDIEEQGNDGGAVINIPNAINQEDECTQLFPT